MCPPHVDTCLLLTLLPDELQGSVWGQNGEEFRQKFIGHGSRHMSITNSASQ